MNWILDLWAREPVIVTAVVVALLDAGVAFGLPLSVEQKTALIATVTAIGAFVARSRVSPVAS